MKCLLAIFILMVMVTDALATAPGPFLNNLPIQKEVKQYENKEYATLKEYVRAFEEGKCSSVWLWMHMPQDGKIDLIEGLKQIYKDKENAIISKPTEYYVQEIDQVIANDQNAQDYKLGVIFRTIAVMEHDFDEGIDKEETARKWLGPFHPVLKEYQKSR